MVGHARRHRCHQSVVIDPVKKLGQVQINNELIAFSRNRASAASPRRLCSPGVISGTSGAQESNRRGLAWIEQNLAPLLTGPATAVAGPVIVHTLA